jgi:hypothetical protein
MEEPDLINLTLDLADTSRYAETVEELRVLRERIDAILDAVDIHSGQVNRSG